jgi:hypothetical protein
MGRLAEEIGTEMSKNRHKLFKFVHNKISDVVKDIFTLSPKISQHFESPIIGRVNDDVTGWLDDVGGGEYVCRIFLKHPTLPEAFQVSTNAKLKCLSYYVHKPHEENIQQHYT